jgi:HEAT repeat protein
MPQLLGIFLLTAALQEPSGEAFFREYQAKRIADLTQRVNDPHIRDLDRWQAYSELEHLDFDAAVRLAPGLLHAGGSIGFHAAWALAQIGDPRGVETLRERAKDRKDQLTYPLQALGRLRDPGSHDLLRRLLEDELTKTGADVSRGRTYALVQSLSDYESEDDGALLVRALRHLNSNDWVSAQDLGRTGSSDAVLFLRELFLTKGQGWTVMSAGLALARCGDARGIRYVEEQLASAEPAREEDRNPTDGVKDDPYGPKAKAFLFEHLGSARDEIFVMQLLTIAEDPNELDRTRALAWMALLRIHSAKYRANVLRSAWDNASFDGASRLIVLDDEESARNFVARDPTGASREERVAVGAVRAALAVNARERRLWVEQYGYGF